MVKVPLLGWTSRLEFTRWGDGAAHSAHDSCCSQPYCSWGATGLSAAWGGSPTSVAYLLARLGCAANSCGVAIAGRPCSEGDSSIEDVFCRLIDGLVVGAGVITQKNESAVYVDVGGMRDHALGLLDQDAAVQGVL